jgi:hypothetical protein
MANQDEFQINLLKTIAAEIYFLCGMQAAREMFGKAYFALGQTEKASVDQAVVGFVTANFQWLKPETFQDQTGKGTAVFQGPQSGGDKIQ